jgi:hypothetical protein
VICSPIFAQTKEFCVPVLRAVDLKNLLPFDSKGTNNVWDRSGSISCKDKRKLTISLKVSAKLTGLTKMCVDFGTKTWDNVYTE